MSGNVDRNKLRDILSFHPASQLDTRTRRRSKLSFIEPEYRFIKLSLFIKTSIL